jgi:hypothetical protein
MPVSAFLALAQMFLNKRIIIIIDVVRQKQDNLLKTVISTYRIKRLVHPTNLTVKSPEAE